MARLIETDRPLRALLAWQSDPVPSTSRSRLPEDARGEFPIPGSAARRRRISLHERVMKRRIARIDSLVVASF